MSSARALRPFAGAAALAGIVAFGVALRWTTPERAGDLRPRPDALEYEEAARHLARGEGYFITIDGDRYRPRYPFGFSVLLAPVLRVHDVGPGTGVVVVLAAAGVAMLATAALGLAAAGPLGAAIATLVVAVSPAHVASSRLVMSDVPTSCGVALFALTLLAALRSDRSAAWLVTGLLGGALASFRVTSVAIVPIAALALWVREGFSRRIAALAVGAIVGASPALAFNAIVFHAPLAGGYPMWAPGTHFGWEYAVGVPVGGGQEGNLRHYLVEVAGGGTLYPWPWALLAAIGLAQLLRSRESARRVLGAVTGGFVLATTATYVVFFWQDTRFLLPCLPLIGAAAGRPFARDVPRPMRGLAGALLALGLVQLARRPDAFAGPRTFGEPAALREIAAHTEPDAIVIARTNEHFFDLLLRSGSASRTWVPLGLDEHRFATRWLRLTPAVRAASKVSWIDDRLSGRDIGAVIEPAVGALVASGRPVYVSSVLAYQVPGFSALLARLRSRFTLERVPSAPTRDLFRILRMTPDERG